MSNKPWRSQHADTDSWGTRGATCYFRLHLKGLRCYNFMPTSRVEKVCRASLTHYLIALISEQKAVQVYVTPLDSLKSQRKRILVVFTLHSTCAHVDTFFFTEMKSFDPSFGSPKMENVSSYIMFLLLLNFQLIRKSWYIEKKKKINQMFFPTLFKRIWTPSSLCCC